MTTNNILVLGGNGKTGRKVVQRLNDLNQNVRIGSRNADIPFDWNQPETWPAALKGMDKVYITYQPDLAVPGALETIEAFSTEAVKSGIQKMVLLSGRGEKEAQMAEEVVMAAGVAWTIVRADWFFQNFSENFFLEPILAGHVAVPRADTKIPFVDTDDIADVATVALMDDLHNGHIYELTGSRLITFEEAIEEIAKETGRDIQFQGVSIEAYVSMLRGMNIPEDYLWLINYLFTNVLDGRNSYLTGGVERALGRSPKDFSQYVKETAATGIWHPNR